MSIYTRDYMRDRSAPRGIGGPSTWSVVTWLIVINTVLMLVRVFVDGQVSQPIKTNLGFSLQALADFKVWTPLTYQFVHQDFFHLLFNMLGLFFLGRALLQIAGPKEVLRIYLLGGLAGVAMEAVFILILGSAFGLTAATSVIGASASVLAIVIAVATILPHQKVFLFPLPIQLTLRQIAFILVGVDLVRLFLLLVVGSRSEVAFMAHLGGMAFGWLYVKYWMPSANQRRRQATQRKSLMDRFGIRILRDAEVVEETAATPEEKKKKNKPQKPFVTKDVDAILDKINEQGFQSLTEEEKRALQKSSKRLSRRIDKDD